MKNYLEISIKTIFSLVILLTFCDVSIAQICNGNLGENIFDKGDFGSGSAPIMISDPNIAPGYTYTTNVPGDGFYTICSSTAALNGLYPTWLRVEDNSPDPNGYMMVVNASFAPGDFYQEVVDGLCENTLYEFSADILNLIKIGVANHIDPNVSFLIDNVVVYTTGDIAKTENWRQFGFSFVTDATQSSITLTLRNNAPGGGGNDLALDNISFRPCGPSSFIGIDSDTTIFLCIDDDPLTVVADIEGAEGQQFAIQWQSSADEIIWNTIEDSIKNTITHTNFAPGDYYYRYYSAANEINILNEKCRIISDVIKLTILPDTYVVFDTICDGLIYKFGNQQLVSSGNYEENFESQYGCDSVVFLELLFIPPQPINIDAVLTDPSCFGLEDGNISLNSLKGGNGDLSFLIYDDDSSLIFSSFNAGNYFVEVLDQYGCLEIFEYQLFDPSELSVALGMDTTIKLGDELLLLPHFSTDFDIILWEGQGEFDCNDCENPTFIPFFDGKVTVMVKDKNGCIASDSITVNIDDQSFLILPNIFSPNEDGVNDFMTINYYGRSISQLLLFNVYDRWGGLVHSLNNIDLESGGIVWDGYMKSNKVSTGVYTYKIQVQLINGMLIDRLGNVTVLK